MSNVVQMFREESADDLLEKIKGKYDRILLLGEKDGKLQIMGSGQLQLSETIYWLECMKLELMMTVAR